MIHCCQYSRVTTDLWEVGKFPVQPSHGIFEHNRATKGFLTEERADDFKRWSDALTGTSEATNLEDRMPDIMEMANYFASLIPERRKHPGDDLISKVVQAEVDGEGISDGCMTYLGFLPLLFTSCYVFTNTGQLGD